MLEQDFEFFQANLSDWIEKYRGFWALVRECELIGLFTKYDYAVTASHRLFPGLSFLLMEILPDSGKAGYFRPEKYAESKALHGIRDA